MTNQDLSWQADGRPGSFGSRTHASTTSYISESESDSFDIVLLIRARSLGTEVVQKWYGSGSAEGVISAVVFASISGEFSADVRIGI